MRSATTRANAPVIPPRAPQAVADRLAGVLADTYVLGLQTQNFHWNVVGPQFYSLHEMFGAQYEEMGAAVDGLAERLRAIGHRAPGSLAEFGRLTAIEETPMPLDAPGMVRVLAEGNERLIRRAQDALAEAEQAGDEGTVDLLVQRVQAHEKHAWMLRSSLEE